MKTQQLVIKYFQSWQEPSNFEEMEECLSPDMKINSGFFAFEDRNTFMSFLEQNSTPWREIELKSTFFSDNFATILYEGINSETNQKMRVSEHLTIEHGKISSIQTVISKIG